MKQKNYFSDVTFLRVHDNTSNVCRHALASIPYDTYFGLLFSFKYLALFPMDKNDDN